MSKRVRTESDSDDAAFVARILAEGAVRRYPKLLFDLVLPWIFPGSYDDDTNLAFRTYLAMTGVCKRLRYWNFLRRWVGWTSPPHLRDRLRSHSFVCPRVGADYMLTQDRFYSILNTEKLLADVRVPHFASRWLQQAFVHSKPGAVEVMALQDSEFEMDIGGSPFFDVVECRCDAKIPSRDRSIFCHTAGSFAEFVLICYAIFVAEPRENPFDAYLIVASWKVDQPKHDFVYFVDGEKLRYLERHALGRIKRTGLTAPQDFGFHHGSLPTTAFAWFMRTCDTNGARNKLTPLARLEAFVNGWFQKDFWSRNTAQKAYELEMNFVAQ